MNTLMVDYDLVSPGQKYAAIAKYLQAYGDWAKGLDSTWFVRTSKSAQEVCADLIKIVDYNDKLIVTNVTSADMWWKGLPDDVSKWLQAKYTAGRFS